jgi:hypothetical protein
MSHIEGDNITRYHAINIAMLLQLYAKTGIKVNRNVTPTSLMARASAITGLKFKARDYMTAHDALMAWANSDASIGSHARTFSK